MNDYNKVLDQLTKLVHTHSLDPSVVRSEVEKKIISLQNEGIPKWKKLIESITAGTSLLRVIDMSFLQFPSLVVRLDLDVRVGHQISSTHSLYLCVSLLCPYYSIYIKDTLTASDSNGSTIPVRNLFREKSFAKEELHKDLIERMHQSMRTHFNDYQFIPHHLLLNTKVKDAVPYGCEDSSLLYSLLYFLFTLFDYSDIDSLILE